MATQFWLSHEFFRSEKALTIRSGWRAMPLFGETERGFPLIFKCPYFYKCVHIYAKCSQVSFTLK